ncbi:IclR family transcriptional regulator domain-containing protein [Actinomadura rubrisoli]|uniref:IclR family transcriptional regulator n=1 Tax=Actinomadura rubrisoli TaxID=2530368 RepID=A0A4R5CGC1_9ACTN|nr:IclR family transcriptional regulator C-terminal domain-containing protein [Actinomadura rubrisoli]TDD96302.1 IclR family transcriptional regulator [Actinomadura rubrisoli]
MTKAGDAGRLGLYVRTFDRGLEVLTCFSAETPELSVTEAAARAGLDRATVRRLLLTLEALRYVEQVDGRYRLTARVLDLGYVALASRGFAELVQPYLDDLSRAMDQSCSLGVLDGEAALFLARAAVRRVMTISLGAGTRVPAYASALGRALLSGLTEEALADYLTRVRLVAYTSRTIIDPGEITRRVERVRRDGWALLDQELEEGVRSVAVPVRGHAGAVVAAISIGTHTSRVEVAELTGTIVPAMIDCARAIERDLTAQPVPLPGVGQTPENFAVM